MAILTVQTKQVAEQLRPLTRKKHVILSLLKSGQTVSTFGSWADGGSRTTFGFVHIATGQRKPANVSTAPPQFGGKLSELRPEPGWALVLGGTFMGKPSTCQLFALDQDASKLFGVRMPLEDAPACIQADWLAENGNPEIADLIRQLS